MKKLTAIIVASVTTLQLAGTISDKVPAGALANKINTSDFVENKGQVMGFDGLPHPEVKFTSMHNGMDIFLLNNGIAYQFSKTYYPEGYRELFTGARDPEEISKIKSFEGKIRTETWRMDMRLKGASPNAAITASEKSEDYTHYYNRNVTFVNHYKKITYHDVYPGIDWIIHRTNGVLKYEFLVKPGADPSQIILEFSDHENLVLNPDGSLTLSNAMGSVTEKTPVSFQGPERVGTRFVISGNDVTFDIESYDHSQPLIIDPTLIWATYYGGNSNDRGFGCATDAAGNVYLGGFTTSSVSIASVGHQNVYAGGSHDAFLVKFGPLGNRLWATYYGGSGIDIGTWCTTDANGYVYLVGSTDSPANISTPGAHKSATTNSDGFLVKFNSSGVRQWATYYGGNDSDPVHGVAADLSGNIYICGATLSSFGIAFNGHQNAFSFSGGPDAYLAKFNSSGVLLWGTYYGDVGIEIGYFCTTDASGNVYLTGHTTSSVSIASGGHQNSLVTQDAFLVKFNGSGVRIWATYYGGPGWDYGTSCAVDGAGNVYFTGYTPSTSSISAGGHQNSAGGNQDGFLVKFNSSGVRQWATYYGGPADDYIQSCCLSASGDIYVTGFSSSTFNIATGGVFQNTPSVGPDVFIAKFDPAGVRLWGSYYGGSLYDFAYGCVEDIFMNVFISGYTSSATGVGFGGFKNHLSGFEDAMLVKISDCPGIIQPSAISGNTAGICAGTVQTYSVISDPNATSYTWTIPSGWTGTSTTNVISVVPSGTGVVSVVATGSCGPGPQSTLAILVTPLPTVAVNSSAAEVCSGQTVVLNGGGADTYTWSGGISNGVPFTPAVSTVYTVTGTNTLTGCSGTTSQTVIVNPLPVITASASSNAVCPGGTVVLTAAGADTYTWTGGAANGVPFSPTATTTFSAYGTNTLTGCTNTVSADLNIVVHPVPGISLTATSPSVCSGGTVTVIASGADTYSWSPPNSSGQILTPTTTTSYSVTGSYTATGCTATTPVIVTIPVIPLPSLTVSASPDTICSGEQSVIQASGADVYTWNTGINSQSINVQPPGTQTYVVTGTSVDGCSNMATIEVYVNECVGLREYNAPLAQVFPVPNNGTFTLILSDGKYLPGREMIISNLMGQTVFRQQLISAETHVSTRLPDGAYLLQLLTNGNTTRIFKLVIKN